MLKVTHLSSGAGMGIQAVFLQFRNKIDKFSVFMEQDMGGSSRQIINKPINMQTRCVGKGPILSREEKKKSYAEKNRL